MGGHHLLSMTWRCGFYVHRIGCLKGSNSSDRKSASGYWLFNQSFMCHIIPTCFRVLLVRYHYEIVAF